MPAHPQPIDPERRQGNGALWKERVLEWRSPLAILAAGLLIFGTLSGIAIWLVPFTLPVQITVFAHTVLGLLFLVPCLWYLVRHLVRYWRNPTSHILLLGYFGGGALLLCLVSGLVLTYQASLRVKIGYLWDTIHIITTFALLAFVLPHVVVIVVRERKARQLGGTSEVTQAAAHYGKGALLYTLGGAALVALVFALYRPIRPQNQFPADYSFKYGKNRPFAPSLATTASGKIMDDRLLSGSRSCGTSDCHKEIVQEWQGSAHRYSAMDVAFQAVQKNMAQQNGPESTRYCGGCHDPISLFSGTKNLFVTPEKLTSLAGFQEGVSCLVCHSVRQVDVKGNANYVIAQPARYMFELEYDRKPREATRFLRDFLLRAYPKQHIKDLGKTLFKTPEYCAACHKQFIDKEINNIGWVQLQNQYDNWKQSRWNHPGNARKTIECRECHMPLTRPEDPASGLAEDYNHHPGDGLHRSHRFIAANQMMPALLKLPDWEKHIELTDQWLQGNYDIPEIADKWQRGPAVALEMNAPRIATPGQKVDVKLVVTSNKVGHDFPTGPLDIIQTWIQLDVKDDRGRVVYHSGDVNSKGFIEPGTFMFKAEPVDQNGNLIDRHNLWEMVGVRYRRSIFPGFSDFAEYAFVCPSMGPSFTKPYPQKVAFPVNVPKGTGSLQIEARLRYRKISQFLVNFLFGEKAGLTPPITDISTASQTITIVPKSARASTGGQ